MSTTEELAHRKRRIERILRGIGFSRAEAKRGAALIVAKYDQDFCSRPSTPWDAGREASKQYAEQSPLPAPARVIRHLAGSQAVP